MTRSELTVTVGTAVLSFCGALLGVYAGSRFEQQNWESRFTLDQRKLLLEKRIATIERVTVALNKALLVKSIQVSIDTEVSLARLAVLCESKTRKEKAKSTACKSDPKANSERMENLVRELHTLNSELAAAVSLASVYFGAKTQESVIDLSKIGFWVATNEQRQALLNSMGAEIGTFSK